MNTYYLTDLKTCKLSLHLQAARLTFIKLTVQLFIESDYFFKCKYFIHVLIPIAVEFMTPCGGSFSILNPIRFSAEREPPCRAPLKSSHLSYLLGAILDWASIPQRLIWTFLVVPVHPCLYDAPRLNRLERVLLDTLFLRLRKNRSMIPFCSGVDGVMNSCCNR